MDGPVKRPGAAAPPLSGTPSPSGWSVHSPLQMYIEGPGEAGLVDGSWRSSNLDGLAASGRRPFANV